MTEPGRYMFRFGWLTVAADDLAVWEQFPNAVFALVKTASAAATDANEEFHTPRVCARLRFSAVPIGGLPMPRPWCGRLSVARSLNRLNIATSWACN